MAVSVSGSREGPEDLWRGTLTAAYLALESLMCWQIVAAHQLVRENRRVETALKSGDTEAARAAVSMIMGRDTDVPDRDGIIRAAVETVAEYASDGVAAPLLCMGLFGAAGGFSYKAVNTMYSMIGYKILMPNLIPR